MDTVCSSLPQYRLREQVSGSGYYTSTYGFTGKAERLEHGSRQRLEATGWHFRDQGCVYAITPPTKPMNQSVIQGMFLLSRLWTRILFESGASHSFITTSCVEELGL